MFDVQVRLWLVPIASSPPYLVKSLVPDQVFSVGLLTSYDHSSFIVASYDKSGFIVASHDNSGFIVASYDKSGFIVASYAHSGFIVASYDRSGFSGASEVNLGENMPKLRPREPYYTWRCAT